MTFREKRLIREVRKKLINDLPKEELEKALEQIKQITHPKNKPLQLTSKVKIHPTPEQEQVLWALAENCRLIYYFANKERKDWWEQNKYLPKNKQDLAKKPTYYSQSAQLPKLKKQYPRYKQNYSKTLQETLKVLATDYKSFHTLRNNGYTDANPPRFKGKKYFTTIHYNQSGFKIEGHKITFNHFYPTKEAKEVNLTFQMEGKFDFINQKIKQVTIFQKYKTKEFFLSIIYEPEEPLYQDNNIYQAIDQGVINLVAAVNSHAGKIITVKNKRVDKYWQPKIEEVQSKRDHCKKYSNKWHWYNDKLSKMIRKQTNQQKDFQHKTSKKIVENTKANTIIIGDLNSKDMSRKKKGDKKNDKSRHRSMQNSGSIARFARFLTYKARKVGKKVIRISERNSSKRCCYCMKKENRKLSERIIICDCGLVIDRDINSAGIQMQRFFSILTLSLKRPMVGQRLLKKFREKFFATNVFMTDNQTSNESSSSSGVGRIRRESFVT
ncbi:MAG: IS200/IS605 family element transposase accessory protein TnpB [Candidatus Heimdallarchaeota archaeon]|nr:IS200/IS605 family element transposase accessory protein TnpB [Candidatus Heimdallarchaeota archaeon]